MGLTGYTTSLIYPCLPLYRPGPRLYIFIIIARTLLLPLPLSLTSSLILIEVQDYENRINISCAIPGPMIIIIQSYIYKFIYYLEFARNIYCKDLIIVI